MNAERLLSILVAPHVSEKSTLLSTTCRQYVFKVIPSAHKNQIKRAIELMFDVKVDCVQTINVRGKGKVFKGRPGNRPMWKKAYVKLEKGHEIDVLAASQ